VIGGERSVPTFQAAEAHATAASEIINNSFIIHSSSIHHSSIISTHICTGFIDRKDRVD
jgi:hypothetical protein